MGSIQVLQNEADVVPLWIDGSEAVSSEGVIFAVYSAKDQKDVHMAQSASTKDVKAAADAAMRAFTSWRWTSATERRDLLLKVADAFEARKSETVALQVAETSCEPAWASFNVTYGIKVIREIASKTTAVFGEMPRMDSEANLALVFKEPIGPSLLIAPWNAAFVLAIRGIASMLAAGCTVVFKASEMCPKTHHLIAKTFAEVGLPKGALNVLQCRRDDAAIITESLIAHPAIRKVEFIGSPNVGRIIGSLAGKYLKPVLMELGGKCAALVLDDANLEDAAEKCIRGAFIHHGQVCFSTERIIVQKSVAEKFTELLEKIAPTFAPGSGASTAIVQKAHDSLIDAKAKGATFLVGGPTYAGKAELVPTIVQNVTENMTIFDNETFGPSSSLYVAEDEEEAIKMANNSAYGLNAAIHTTNMHRAIRVGRRLEFGQVHVNNMTTHNEATFPIGGTKGSGWGRNNAQFGIEEFVQLKTISLNMNGSTSAFGGSA